MKRISMLKIKEILRLKEKGNLSNRKIGKVLNISHSVINTNIKQFNSLDISYDKFILLNDSEIKSMLNSVNKKEDKYPIPNWNQVHLELRNKIVTLALLHEEYITSCGGDNKGYGYTWFCNNYKKFSKKVNPSMRLVHKAGEKIFIDFSGKTMPIVNEKDGTITDVKRTPKVSR